MRDLDNFYIPEDFPDAPNKLSGGLYTAKDAAREANSVLREYGVNARLIAAAPELLHALRTNLSALEGAYSLFIGKTPYPALMKTLEPFKELLKRIEGEA